MIHSQSGSIWTPLQSELKRVFYRNSLPEVLKIIWGNTLKIEKNMNIKETKFESSKIVIISFYHFSTKILGSHLSNITCSKKQFVRISENALVIISRICKSFLSRWLF